MKRSKMILSVLLAISLLLAMTACGSGKASSEDTAQIADYDAGEICAKAVKAISEAEKTYEDNNYKYYTEDLSQTEYNSLTGDSYKAWDSALNEVWECLGLLLSSEEMDALKSDQENWLNEREQKMKEAGMEVEGGSMQPMLEMATGSRETMVRCYELASKLGPVFTYELIKSYGFENGESRLGYAIQENSVVEDGDYFIATVDLYRPVKIPANMSEGDVYCFDLDLEKNETDAIMVSGDTLVADSGMEYYYFTNQSDGDWVELYCFSDDRVDTHFYTGEIRIAKDAVHNIPVMNEESVITMEKLNSGLFFNGAYFTDSVLTKMISYGD